MNFKKEPQMYAYCAYKKAFFLKYFLPTVWVLFLRTKNIGFWLLKTKNHPKKHTFP